MDTKAKKWVEGFIDYLHNLPQGPLYFEESLVENFVESVLSNTMTIIGGASGSGKSSLCRHFLDYSAIVQAEAADSSQGGKSSKRRPGIGEAKPHPHPRAVTAQSSWQSRKCLCGHYDDDACDYILTPFMDALLCALRDRSRDYFFFIDSIDLGYVEGFLSDVIACIASERPMPIHDRGRCVPVSTSLPEERNLICHNDCYSCFFASKSYDTKAIPQALTFFAPPHVVFPDNFHVIGTLIRDQVVDRFRPWMLDKISWIFIPAPTCDKWSGYLEARGTVPVISRYLEEVADHCQSLCIPSGWRVLNRMLTFIERKSKDLQEKDLVPVFERAYLREILPQVRISLIKDVPFDRKHDFDEIQSFSEKWGFHRVLEELSDNPESVSLCKQHECDEQSDTTGH